MIVSRVGKMKNIKIKIKTFQEMAKFLNPNPKDWVAVRTYFVNDLKDFLPKDRIIEVVKDGNKYLWHLKHETWEIFDFMIKEILK